MDRRDYFNISNPRLAKKTIFTGLLEKWLSEMTRADNFLVVISLINNIRLVHDFLWKQVSNIF